MKSSTSSSQAQCDCPGCQNGGPSRPRYFPRQLITPEEMTLEADYFRDMFRRMRRYLWGPGVVCGAVVRPVPKAGLATESAPTTGTPQATGTSSTTEPWKVVVTSGYVISPYGDEIIIADDLTLDLRGTSSGDPWSADPMPLITSDNAYYVAVRYAEAMTRPVRTQPVGCGGDDTACEYSRFCDGYKIGILPIFPEQSKTGTADVCPEWPSNPWVFLAKVTPGAGGEITSSGIETKNRIDLMSVLQVFKEDPR